MRQQDSRGEETPGGRVQELWAGSGDPRPGSPRPRRECLNRRRSDAGASTVPAVGIAALAVALALLVGAIAQGLGARSRADTAADLAALAVVQAAGSEACASGEEVARRNGATVTECISRPDLGRASVTVTVPLGVAVAGLGDDLTVTGTAVAGRTE